MKTTGHTTGRVPSHTGRNDGTGTNWGAPVPTTHGSDKPVTAGTDAALPADGE